MKVLFRAKQSKLLLLLMAFAMALGFYAASPLGEQAGAFGSATIPAASYSPAEAESPAAARPSNPWSIASQGSALRPAALLHEEDHMPDAEKISARREQHKTGKAKAVSFPGLSDIKEQAGITGFDSCALLPFTLSAKNSASVIILYIHDQDGSKEV